MTIQTIHDEHVRLGFRSGNCDACYRADQHADVCPCFECEPRVSWHDRARARTLPTSIVGGIPRTTPAPRTVTPVAVLGGAVVRSTPAA